MILCTFTGVCVALVAMVYADGGAQHKGIALTGSQMRSERRLEGTRGTLRQDKRNAQKRNTAVVVLRLSQGWHNLLHPFCGDVWRWCGRSRNRTQAKVPFQNF